MILDARFSSHQPLNRQSEMYAREGIDLDVSTLADWVGACTATLSPLVALIRDHVLTAERIHGDDTTVPVLAKGKTITGLCLAHGRRNFFKLAQLAKAPLAIEAVRRIDAIFDLERAINGLPHEQRRAKRQDKIAPLVTDLENWMGDVRRKLSRHVEVAKAIDYMLKRWASFSRFLDDGRICLTNNAAERALRGIALAEKHGCSRVPTVVAIGPLSYIL
jgi:hypothetical protein